MLLSEKLSTGFYNILDQVPEPCAELLYRPIELSETAQRRVASHLPEHHATVETVGNAVAAASAPVYFAGAVLVFASLCLDASFNNKQQQQQHNEFLF